MSIYGEDKERELQDRLSAYIHEGADYGNSGDLKTNTPGSPDSLFEARDSPGPSNIATAFATAASNSIPTNSLSIRQAPSEAFPEVQVQADADNGDWESTDDATASRAGSVEPEASSAAATGGAGRIRNGYRGRGMSAASGSPSVGFGRGRGSPAPAESNVAVLYKCWSCNAMVSIKRKEKLVMCAGCGGRIVMKLRPERTVIYSTM